MNFFHNWNLIAADKVPIFSFCIDFSFVDLKYCQVDWIRIFFVALQFCYKNFERN